MPRALWIVVTARKDYSHVLIRKLISLCYGSGLRRVVLIKEHFNLICFLKLMAQIWDPPYHRCLNAGSVRKHGAGVGF